jgi:tetratricopeptide (TPR) repeat protein
MVEFDEALAAANPEPIEEKQRALMDAAAQHDTPEGSVDLWKKAIAADPKKRAPRRALARVYAFLERWRPLAEALKEEEATACATVEERVAVLLELAVVFRDHLKHDIPLTATLERALELDPDNVPIIDHLAEQYEEQRRWPELISTLERKAQRMTDPTDRFTLYLRMAQLFLERMNKEIEAVQALEVAHSLRPGDALAKVPLEQLYEKRRDWAKLIALRGRELERVEDPALRLKYAVELALLASERVKALEPAASAWRGVLAIEPAHDQALTQLEQLYTRYQEWQRLLEVYELRVQQTSGEAKVAWLQKMALLCTNSLDEPVRAIEAWRSLLEIAPGNLRAQDALKRLYVAGKAWEELEAFFALHGAFDQFVRVLEQQVVEEDPATRVQLWERMAVLYRDALARPDRALRAFEKVLELEPDRRSAAEALIPIYQQSKDLKKLVFVLTVQLKHTQDPDVRQVRLRRLAELCETGLRDLAGAQRWWLAAFADDPRSDGARSECERMAQATGNWAELVEAYNRASEGEIEPKTAILILAVMAKAQEEKLDDPSGAVRSLRRILELDERNLPAANSLERLYLARDEHAQLSALYQHLAGLATTVSERRLVRYRLARLADSTGNEEQAIAAFRGILDEGPGEREALEALERLYQRRGQFAELVGVLEAQLKLVEEGEPCVAIQFRLATLREGHLDDAAGAVELYRLILEAQPSHAGACAALEKRLGDPVHRLTAARLLEPIWERAGEWKKLVEVRELILGDTPEVAKQMTLLHSIAALHVGELDSPQAAHETLGRALKVDPSHLPTLHALEKLTERLGDWPALAQLYREVAKRPLSLAQQVDVRCRLGRLYLERLGERERAEATFTRVLDLDQGNQQAAQALAELRARR